MLDPRHPFELLERLAAAQQQMQEQAERLHAAAGPRQRTGRHVEIAMGADGSLTRLHIHTAGPLSAVANEARDLWLLMGAEAARDSSQALTAEGIQLPDDLPKDVRAAREEQR